MMPVGPLMIEHRLIERMIAVLEGQARSAESPESIDLYLLGQGIDFLKTYADRCHHGKEEDYLFKALAGKSLSEELTKIFNELMEEHSIARATVKKLAAAREKALQGDPEAYREIAGLIARIAELYPAHIEKEDRHFFIPVMDYFSAEEKDSLLEEFRRFDQGLIHEKYRSLIEMLELTPQPKKKNSAPIAGEGSIYECEVCGYRYDPKTGDAEHQVPAGIPFEDLPENWVCPLCRAARDMFRKVD